MYVDAITEKTPSNTNCIRGTKKVFSSRIPETTESSVVAKTTKMPRSFLLAKACTMGMINVQKVKAYQAAYLLHRSRYVVALASIAMKRSTARATSNPSHSQLHQIADELRLGEVRVDLVLGRREEVPMDLVLE